MAQTPEDQRQLYPLPAYNFRVTVDGAAMSFAEVSGIAVEHEAVTYRHGLSFCEGEAINTFYWDEFRSITLKRGTVLGPTPLALYQWLKAKDCRQLDVSLCDETGTAVISWKIQRAVPVKLEAPTFDADTNDVSIDSLELKARGVALEVVA
ncbi:MAG: phage tail protein [bacterium]|nr:phage tail protein [bacterium]